MNGRPRGRPRAFDADTVIDQAVQLFLNDGFEATSLDDIALATGVARPSLFAAFGNKEAIYVKSMERFSARIKGVFEAAFKAPAPLPRALKRFYLGALDIYLSGPNGPSGCLVFCTASGAAIRHNAIKKVVANLASEGDRAFEDVFRRTRARGELASTADAAALAVLASGTLQTLAVRARAGVPRKHLENLVDGAIGVLCGTGKQQTVRHRGDNHGA
jgi:AcrR family transcriptional regulator